MQKRFWGAALVIVGVLALVQSTGQYSLGLEFWPVIWTLVGLNVVLGSLRRLAWVNLAFGLFLAAFGLFDILYNAGVTTFAGTSVLRLGWPLLLIAVGISIMGGRRFFRVSRCCNGKGHYDYRIVGDVRYGTGQGVWRIDKDLALDHGVGDVKLDLSTAEITEGVHRIRVTAAIGEVVIRVPGDMSFTVDAKTGIGELDVLGDHRSGLGLEVQKEFRIPGAQTELNIECKLGIGSLRVIPVAGQPGRLVL